MAEDCKCDVCKHKIEKKTWQKDILNKNAHENYVIQGELSAQAKVSKCRYNYCISKQWQNNNNSNKKKNEN